MSYVRVNGEMAKIVSEGFTQNLARERALHFSNTHADEEPLSSLPPKHKHPLALKHTSSAVVVTTAETEENGDVAVDSTRDEEALRTKPRGFFADQFEACSAFKCF